MCEKTPFTVEEKSAKHDGLLPGMGWFAPFMEGKKGRFSFILLYRKERMLLPLPASIASRFINHKWSSNAELD